MPEALDWDYEDLSGAFPGRSKLNGLKLGQFDLVELFIRPLRVHVPALKDLLEEQPAEVFVSHTIFYGGGWLQELGGPPNATLGDTCLTYPSRDAAPPGMGLAPRGGRLGRLRNRGLQAMGRSTFFPPVAKAAREVRSDLGLPPVPIRDLEFGLSRNLHVQLCPPGFEYPRSDLPAYVHFVGAPEQATPVAFDPPSWWPRLLEAKRVVLVTQGTIANDPADLLAPSLEGLAGRDVFVVATTGGADPGALGDPPPNAVVERYLPYGALLPHVDAMVSNGGFGSVQLAISHAVPMVVAGTSEDKKEVSAHVAWSGVGINLRMNRPSPKAVAGAVERVLRDPAFRERTVALKKGIGEGSPPAERAVDLLERLTVDAHGRNATF
jgi:UDP:flavonoid glycosyltransferase YjiC (YdhE family)